MKKYVYDNHEIDEGMYNLYQLLDLFEGKYSGCLPEPFDNQIKNAIKILELFVNPLDKYKEVDFVDTRLICQYVYKKKDVKKYKRDKIINKFEKKK